MTVINVSRRKEDAGKIFSATSCPSCEALRGEAEGFGTLTPEITLQVQKGNRKMSSTAISEPVRGKSLGLSAAPTALRQRAAGVGFSLLCWGAYCCYKKPDSQLENRNTDFVQNRHNQDLKPTWKDVSGIWAFHWLLTFRPLAVSAARTLTPTAPSAGPAAAWAVPDPAVPPHSPLGGFGSDGRRG